MEEIVPGEIVGRSVAALVPVWVINTNGGGAWTDSREKGMHWQLYCKYRAEKGHSANFYLCVHGL
jgi:hypothetical protein